MFSRRWPPIIQAMVANGLVQGHIDRLLSDAEAALREDNPSAARLLAQAVLALEPGNRTALRYLGAAADAILHRREARQAAPPLPAPGPIQEVCEATLRRELRGVTSSLTLWLEAHSVSSAGRKLVYRSGEWKAGKDAHRAYEREMARLVQALVDGGWQLLACDRNGYPRFKR